MNVEKLKQILIESKIYIKESSKNIIAKCPFCGDHPDPKKAGHLYISTDSEIPIAHCFFCNYAVPIDKLIVDLTGNKTLSKEVVPLSERKRTRKIVKKTKERSFNYQLPKIDFESFIGKRAYIKTRSNNKWNPEEIPNLVFDFLSFFRINNLENIRQEELSVQEIDILHNQCVAFLSKHHTTLYCRNVGESWLKFKKIPLQQDSLMMLDYWSIPGGDSNSNIVVLAEGNFDIIGEYVSDSLHIKNKVRLYASGNSFSYSSLLKSICFDENLFRCNVIILSDRDKQPEWYRKFRRENDHIIDKLEIYANKSGKDFGIFPQRPFKYKDSKY